MAADLNDSYTNTQILLYKICVQKIGRLVYFLMPLKLSFKANEIYEVPKCETKLFYEYTFLIMRGNLLD